MALLFELPPCEEAPAADEQRGKPRYKPVQRDQSNFVPVKLERLLEEDHEARAVWEMTQRLDFRRWDEKVKAVEGQAGRAALNPRMLTAVWLYGLSKGVSSARELSERCNWEAAYQWLTGLTPVNYHTLSDFRQEAGEFMQEAFVEVLGILTSAGLVTLERVTQDGTKIRANAGRDTMRTGEKLATHLEEARAHLREVEAVPEAEGNRRRQAARERAAREKVARLGQAVEELAKIRAGKTAKEQAAARVSESDPQSRIMKEGNGGYSPCFNVQVVTDTAAQVIVGLGVVQAGSDAGELLAGMAQVEENLGQKPGQAIVDGGYTNRANVMGMEAAGIEMIGSWPDCQATGEKCLERRGVAKEFYPNQFVYEESSNSYTCPAGKSLRWEGDEAGEGVTYRTYRGQKEDCGACPHQGQCCPQVKRGVRCLVVAEDSPVVRAFREKMETAEAKAVYRLRARVAEFTNAWLKDKHKFRQFRLRGLAKARTEALWHCLVYNIQTWIRLCWRAKCAPTTG